MDRDLSSRLTFVFKFVVPPIGILGLGYGSFNAWFRPDVVGIGGGQRDLEMYRWATLLFLVIGSVWLSSFARLKQVIATDAGLILSDYRRRILMPFDQIRRVSDKGAWVRIEFSEDGGFGRTVEFLPDFGDRRFLREHPVVSEIRTLAERCGGVANVRERGRDGADAG